MKPCHGQFGRPKLGRQGFTLAELLIVMAIVGILASLAAPAFSQFIKSQRIKSMASDLNASLTLARSEAIKRNANATITPTGTWQGGWQITVPNLSPPPAPDIVVETHSAFTGLTVSGPAAVTYQSSGRVQGTTAPTFTISATGVSDQRCVSVDLSGRPNVKASAC